MRSTLGKGGAPPEKCGAQKHCLPVQMVRQMISNASQGCGMRSVNMRSCNDNWQIMRKELRHQRQHTLWLVVVCKTAARYNPMKNATQRLAISNFKRHVKMSLCQPVSIVLKSCVPQHCVLRLGPVRHTRRWG